MAKLTQRQSEVLQLITNTLESTGAPPTRAEIAASMGFRSPNAAEDHLRALARKGVIELLPGTSRGIRLSKSHQHVPMVHLECIEQSLLHEDNIVESRKIDKTMFNQSVDFLLRMPDNSMAHFGVIANDLLAIHIQKHQPAHQQLVIVRLDKKLLVKPYCCDKAACYQQGKHQDQSEINVDPTSSYSIAVEGIVLGLLRSY